LAYQPCYFHKSKIILIFRVQIASNNIDHQDIRITYLIYANLNLKVSIRDKQECEFGHH